ncbi:uncharacterized protein LOC127282128 isoform X2 [Leptopilina boulardi]|uniref:uncharacterized protein LOC127282128 isoform X2 n=1 Tax=Leptopilina boulardi TaxID=63433 RepID=UPI0021F5B310|nr:uncharacterized protein LOC127282128 isoform X2 [Leptopilina boulardi]
MLRKSRKSIQMKIMPGRIIICIHSEILTANSVQHNGSIHWKLLQPLPKMWIISLTPVIKKLKQSTRWKFRNPVWISSQGFLQLLFQTTVFHMIDNMWNLSTCLLPF